METQETGIKTAVVILNWNGKAFLEKFLSGIIEHSNAEIVIADNASTDDSIPWVREHFPGVRILEMSKNTGFTGGYNEALQQVKAQYYILLNSDIEVTPGWVDPLIRILEENPDVAACQPKLRAYERPTHFEYAGAAGGFIDKWGYPFCRGRLFDTLEEDRGQYNDTMEVFWATGACLCIKAELFHRVKGFDDYFFAHMEEIDLCWRLKNLGYKIICCPESEILHVGGGTLPKTNPRKTYLNFRNNLTMLYKNLPEHRVSRVIFLRIILDIVAAYKALLTGNVQEYIAIARAHYAFFTSGKLRKQKRKQSQAMITEPNMAGMHPKSIVWEYFIKGKKKYSELVF